MGLTKRLECIKPNIDSLPTKSTLPHIPYLRNDICQVLSLQKCGIIYESSLSLAPHI